MIYLAILIDRSRSMGESFGGVSKFRIAVEGVRLFLENDALTLTNVAVNIYLFPPKELIQVLNDYYLPSMIFSSDIDRLLRYRLFIGTPIGKALINLAKKHQTQEPLIIKLLSDGEWTVPQDPEKQEKELQTLEETIKNKNIRIDLINIYGNPTPTLTQFIKKHNGTTTYATNPNQIAKTLTKL